MDNHWYGFNSHDQIPRLIENMSRRSTKMRRSSDAAQRMSPFYALCDPDDQNHYRVINETMRMYPSVSTIFLLVRLFVISPNKSSTQATMIPKVATEDTTLTTSTNTFGDTTSVLVPIPKGSYVALNIPALHYNREHTPVVLIVEPLVKPCTFP